MKKYYLFISALIFSLLGACATNPDGTRPAFQPILPVEVSALSNQTTWLLLRKNNSDITSVEKAKVALMAFNSTVQTVIMEDPGNLEIIGPELIAQLDVDVGVLVKNITQIALIRVRVLIDQGQTKDASDYLNAVVDGAVEAMDLYITTKMSPENQNLNKTGFAYAYSLVDRDFDIGYVT